MLSTFKIIFKDMTTNYEVEYIDNDVNCVPVGIISSIYMSTEPSSQISDISELIKYQTHRFSQAVINDSFNALNLFNNDYTFPYNIPYKTNVSLTQGLNPWETPTSDRSYIYGFENFKTAYGYTNEYPGTVYTDYDNTFELIFPYIIYKEDTGQPIEKLQNFTIDDLPNNYRFKLAISVENLPGNVPNAQYNVQVPNEYSLIETLSNSTQVQYQGPFVDLKNQNIYNPWVENNITQRPRFTLYNNQYAVGSRAISPDDPDFYFYVGRDLSILNAETTNTTSTNKGKRYRQVILVKCLYPIKFRPNPNENPELTEADLYENRSTLFVTVSLVGPQQELNPQFPSDFTSNGFISSNKTTNSGFGAYGFSYYLDVPTRLLGGY
jgi:hypothetical protein